MDNEVDVRVIEFDGTGEKRDAEIFTLHGTLGVLDRFNCAAEFVLRLYRLLFCCKHFCQTGMRFPLQIRLSLGIANHLNEYRFRIGKESPARRDASGQ